MAISLERTLSLIGGLVDSDSSKKRFRDFLSSSEVGREDLVNWVGECLSKTDRAYGFALQDIINEIGRRLGFNVESGLYVGRANEIGHDGIWGSESTEIHLVIESKKSTAYELDPSKVGDYLDRLTTERNWKKDDAYGLYVTGVADTHVLVSTIRGSDHRDRIRIIPVAALLRLFKLKEEETLSHEKLVKLLVPMDTINLGELVDLIEGIIVEQEISEDTPRMPIPSTISSETHESVITRKELEGLPAGEVAVFPSKRSGVNFLLTYNAWAFVSIRHEPHYFALYVSAPDSRIQYFGEVSKIIDPGDAESPVRANYKEFATYEEGKKLVLLKVGSIKRLDDPVPIGNQTAKTRGLFYTTIEKLSKAKTLDDL